jgi:DNA (cytosine-5)-methyltransferase 1
MRYLSLFSGYGGFELGIQQAYENQKQTDGQDNKNDFSSDMLCGSRSDIRNSNICVGFSEIDSYAIKVYEKHFPYEECEICRTKNERKSEVPSPGDSERRSGEQPDDGAKGLTCNCKHKPYGDITKLDPSTLPDFELLVGGFPCQAFSIAGKRAGFEDTRGTLIYDVFRIIKEKHPKLVLLENVKGLLSHDNGRTFKTIITSLAELGYAVEWQVLNAKNFGVPQNRERVFIIGHLGGFGGRQVFPITKNDCEDIILPTITTRITADSNGTYVRKRQAYQKIKRAPLKFLERNQKNIEGDYAFTVDSMNTGGVNIDSKIRRLTPTECERLMGLPDGWTEGVSDTQRYKLCGNGVVVNVVKEIIKRLNSLN